MLKEYKDGNILSLSVRNFQTFSNQRFRFGPSLNLIAAPNGSGKSSIANAIAFAFNGSPRTIGKSKDMAEYIKFGCQEAEICVEVWFKEQKVRLSRRVSANYNYYYIDEELVAQRRYFELLKEMNIDVNNLCTFLPQERVGEFCKMDPRELLEELTRGTRIDMSVVKELYDRRVKVEEALHSNEEKKKIIEGRLNLLKSDMEEIRGHEESAMKLAKLEYKKDYIHFEHLKHRFTALKREYKEAKEKIEDAERSVSELREKIAVCESKPAFIEHRKSIDILLAQNEQLRAQGENLRAKVEKMEMLRSDKDKIGRKITQGQTDIAEKQREYSQIKADYENAGEEFYREIKQFKNKIIQICSKPEFEGLLSLNGRATTSEIASLEDLDSFMPSLGGIDDRVQECNFELSRIQNISQEIQRKIEDLERQKQIHSGQDSLRMDMLRKYHCDTHKGVLWLRENRHMFKDEVLEPLYLHLEVDKNYQQYVEPFLGFQALSSFIAKNDQDFSLLTSILKDRQNLSINVAMHSQCKMPGISKTDIRRYNLDGVLSDFIQCRQEYRDFLNNYGHFNTIPVSTREVNEEEVYSSIPECKRMAVGSRYSEIKKSRYGDDYVIITNRLAQKGLFNFPKIDVDGINAEMDALQREREKNKVRVERILEQKNGLNEKKALLKRELDVSVVTKAAFNMKRLMKNLEFCENQLKELKGARHAESLKAIEQEIRKTDKELRAAQSAIEEILDIENIPKVDIEATRELKLDIDNFTKQLQYFMYLRSMEEERLQAVGSSKEAAKAEVKGLKQRLDSYPEVGSLEGLPETVDELEDQINFFQAKLRINRGQSNVKEDYQQKQGLLERISNDMVDLSADKAELDNLYNREKERLIEEISLKVAPVNEIFMRMFERFDCSGRLELNTEQRDWELRVLVKFRENEDLQQLSNFRQSGGEKSLTTVLFLLSLQQCEATPFRLVDEVNQGMDTYNEKKVFEILGEMGDKSQFFIITPKLSADLVFSEDTTAIIVYGGPGITKDIEEYSMVALSS